MAETRGPCDPRDPQARAVGAAGVTQKQSITTIVKESSRLPFAGSARKIGASKFSYGASKFLS